MLIEGRIAVHVCLINLHDLRFIVRIFTFHWPTVFMERSPSDSYSLTLRVRLSTRAGTLGEVATAIGKAGGDIGAIDIVSAGRDYIIRDITVNTVSSEHEDAIVQAVAAIDGIEVEQVSDRTFLMHLGGKNRRVS